MTITRKVHGKGYAYYKNSQKISDPREIERLNGLAIPPAWRDVKIAQSKTAKVQATGLDAAGRQQNIYHASFRARQEKAKFQRILQFADRLPAMRQQIEKDLNRQKFHKEKVLALIVKLMDEAYFRVGNETYARQHQTYGITTIRRKHLSLRTDSVTFDFIGKSGKAHHKKISDRRIARLLRQLDELPGYEVFQYIDEHGETHKITSRDVNEYIKIHMGEIFTAKDFRTWGGTLLATTELAAELPESNETKRKKRVTHCVKKVARRLGNTPAVTRGSYIDPRVISAYMSSDSLATIRETVSHMKPKKYLSQEERLVMELLKAET